MPLFPLEFEVITPGCPTDLLRFDQQNPRLEDGLEDEQGPEGDREMITSLRDVAALGELIASITANGFKKIEPMIVMGEDGGPYTVLEGNRRLACIKVLRDPALAEACGIAVPKPVPPDVLESIQTATVYRVLNAEAARAFIGFKHINGPHKWESFAKARFVTTWWKEARAAGLTINAIAEKLGDDNNTIKNMIAGMLVLEQAQSMGFSISDRFNRGRFAFSHLYTALTRSEYADFLALPKGWTQNLGENPVPGAASDKLKEVMLWLYGSKARNKPALIKSQNPDLADLGDAMQHAVALSVLRGGRSLAEAKLEFRPATEVLGELLVDINAKLREAVQLAGRASDVDPSLVDIADQIERQGKSLHLLLQVNQSAGRITPATGAAE